MRGGDKYKQKSKPKPPIAKRSNKRAKDERRYKDQAREFFDEAVNNKTNYCIFCDELVVVYEGLHHLRGRIGDYLLDKEWWAIVHNECHVDNYHQASYEQRVKQVWWDGFLARLKAKSEELYNKEIKKGEKVHKLNPTFDFNDDY